MSVRSALLPLPLVLVSGVLPGCHARKAGPDATATSGDSAPSDATSRNSLVAPGAEDLATLRANFLKVNFGFDEASLDASSRSALEANADILVKYSAVHVRIEGHTDNFGSDEYNLALGQRRAQSVHRYLLDLGVSPSKLSLISFGREKPVVEPGTKEQEAANRRAEFVVVAGSDVAESSDAQPGVQVTLEVNR